MTTKPLLLCTFHIRSESVNLRIFSSTILHVQEHIFLPKLCQHNLSRTTCIYEVVGKKKGGGRDRGGGEGEGREGEKEGGED